MHIWKQAEITPDSLNKTCKNTMVEALNMTFTAVGDNYLQIQMPVTATVHQPYGLLHGGASAALAETAGSMASSLCIDPDKEICVGIEINCNHIRGVRSGIVTATARPLHVGRATHVWDIRITDEQDRLVCISRLTVAVLQQQ